MPLSPLQIDARLSANVVGAKPGGRVTLCNEIGVLAVRLVLMSVQPD